MQFSSEIAEAPAAEGSHVPDKPVASRRFRSRSPWGSRRRALSSSARLGVRPEHEASTAKPSEPKPPKRSATPVKRAVGRMASTIPRTGRKSRAGRAGSTANGAPLDAGRTDGDSLRIFRAAVRSVVTVARIADTHELATRIARVLSQMGSGDDGLSLSEWCQGCLSQPLILHCFGVVPETPELVTRASSSHPALSRQGSDTSQQLTDRSEALVDDEDHSDQDQGSDPVSENAEEEADGDGGAEVQTVHLDLRVGDGCR